MKKVTKKMMAILFALTMTASMVGCGAKEQAPASSAPAANAPASSAPAEKAPVKSIDLLMGTGGMSGSYYPIGSSFCTEMSKSDYVNVTVQNSAGGVENMNTLISRERELGMAQSSVCKYAYEGSGPFEGLGDDSIRALFAFSPMSYHVVVRADSPYTCLNDLKGASVAVGNAGSGDELTAREVFGGLGMSYDDFDEKYLSVNDMADAFKDGNVDAMTLLVAPPSSTFLDAAVSVDCRMIPISGDEKAAIQSAYPYYADGAIPAGAYTFNDEDVETLSMTTLLCCTTDLDEETVYQMLVAMFDGVETIQQGHSSMANFGLDNCLSGVSIPLHPGAERFFKEAGIL